MIYWILLSLCHLEKNRFTQSKYTRKNAIGIWAIRIYYKKKKQKGNSVITQGAQELKCKIPYNFLTEKPGKACSLH